MTHSDAVQSRRRITVDEYHHMIDAGALGEDDRVQLIGGAVVAMTPQGPAHALAIQSLTRLLGRALPSDLVLRPQLPLTFAGDSEPEPDLAVLRLADASSREHHPRTALLVVEVAGDSLRLDRETKAALYARGGIPEYWIVNLAESTVEVHRDPDPSRRAYRVKTVVPSEGTLAATSVPGVRIDVADLFR
ncbi:MAG TPA: Uma2 family endonuclease [Vicinamibacteria bacterium]|nr:Uma2 family endonuclease [Vicinamibacteria bacterium]